MLLLPSTLLWLFAAVLEALAAWVLFGPHAFGMPVVLALFLHLLYALALAGAGHLSLPKRYRRPVWAGLAYLFSAALFVPVLSWFGLLFALLPALHWPKRVEPDDWQDIPQPDLPFRTIEVDPDAVYRRGGLGAWAVGTPVGKIGA
ncbi:MAG TPA: hypothetical protein VFQ88_00255 [Nevskiaceae bacterium]|nr:hypothetical protein [Nevskiaceae bacterium]